MVSPGIPFTIFPLRMIFKLFSAIFWIYFDEWLAVSGFGYERMIDSNLHFEKQTPHLVQISWLMRCGFLRSPVMAVHRAVLEADHAARAFLLVDRIGQQRPAYLCRAFFMVDMRFVFIPEIPDRGKNRVRRCLPEAAKRIILDLVSQFFQFLNISLSSFAVGDPFKDLEHPLGAHPAEGTFPAGFLPCEIEEELGHIDHAGGFIHDDHTAGTHDGAGGIDRIIIDDGIGKKFGDTSAGRSSHLDGFEFLVVFDPAAKLEDHVADGHAHGHFNQPGVLDLSGKGKNLGSLALLRAVFCIGLGPVAG